MAGIPFAPYSVNDEAAHGPCVSSLVPITVDGIGFLLGYEPCSSARQLSKNKQRGSIIERLPFQATSQQQAVRLHRSTPQTASRRTTREYFDEGDDASSWIIKLQNAVNAGTTICTNPCHIKDWML